MLDEHLNICKDCVILRSNTRYHKLKNNKDFKLKRKIYHKKRSKIKEDLDSKICKLCKNNLSISQFGSRKGSKDGYREYCKKCYKILAKLDYENNKARYFHHAKARSMRLLKAMPKWLTSEQIAQIKLMYKNCPKNHHVDHIIPIKGKTVSGLHVPWNLQYLPGNENLKKGNRFVF